MSAILPALAKAAGIGTLLGVGGELVRPEFKGRWFLVSVITSVALRALSFYLGAGVAAGTFIGVCMGLMKADSLSNASNARVIGGGALIGGTLGYLLEFTPLSGVVIVL